MKRWIACFLCLCCLAGAAGADPVSFGGLSFDSASESVDLGGRAVGDKEWNAFIAFLKKFPDLKRVDMFATPIRTANVDRLVKAFPGVEFGWTLQLMYYKDRHIVRSDATYFSTKHGVCPNHNNKDFTLLKYCTNLLALDLGHNNITDLSFLRSMPRLRVLILAENQKLKDITPIGELRDLEYLELFWTAVQDLTPLKSLPNLMDLNLSKTTLLDISPLLEMKQLRRLWLANVNILVSQKSRKTRKLTEDEMQALRDALPDTEIVFTGDSDGSGWRYYDDKIKDKDPANLVPHFAVISQMMKEDTYIPFPESAPLPGQEAVPEDPEDAEALPGELLEEEIPAGDPLPGRD